MIEIKGLIEKAQLRIFILKDQYANFSYLVRKGIIIGLCIMGIGLLTNNLFKTAPRGIINPKFSDISVVPKEGIKIIEKDKERDKEITLVLYRVDCKACGNVEKEVVREVGYLSSVKNANRDYIVMDIEKMTKDQFDYILQEFPQIVLYGNRIPSPLLANAKIKDKKWHVTEFSNSDDLEDIKKVLEE